VAVVLEPAQPVAGEPFEVVALVANTGTGPATEAMLAIKVPDEARVDLPTQTRATTPAGCARGTSTVTCSLGTIEPGAAITRRISMTVRDVLGLTFTGDSRAAGYDTATSGGQGRLRTATVSRTSQGGPPLPPPKVGETANALRSEGRVYIRLPGSSRLVPLTKGRQIPVGSFVDTTRGRVQLVMESAPHGPLQSGLFRDGGFVLRQADSGRTTLQLAGGRTGACRRDDSHARTAQNDDNKPKGKRTRRVWARAKGKFRTRGKTSAASVRGTTWLTEDYCNGTLTLVKTGVVEVRDLLRNRTVTVKRGESVFIPS
jgi:hypothetical protein